MKKLLFALSFLPLAGMAQVGVGTASPQAKLHVQGDLRVDSLKTTAEAEQMVVVDTANRIFAVQAIEKAHTMGDVKQGFQSGDHGGWVKLDGRALTSLNAARQSEAASLGFSGNLPDATDAYLSQDGGTLGATSGSNAKTIGRANLPNVTLGGSTSTDGAHSHSISRRSNPDANAYDPGGGRKFENSAATTDRTILGTFNTSTSGAHSHTITTESLNGNVAQQDLDITPKTLSVNTFVFLGN